jgi:hypothetical protein
MKSKICILLRLIVMLTVVSTFLVSKGICGEYDFEYENETIFKETRWSGKVLIKGVLTIFADTALTIEPGTVIMFKKIDSNKDNLGECEIYIQGEIIAEGTKESPIIFTSAEEDKKPGDWIAINMMVSENKRNIFKNCVLEYSYRGFHAHFSSMNIIECEIKNNFLAVQFQDSEVTIKKCNIHDNNQGIQFRDSKLEMEDTKIIGNNIGIRCVYSDVDFLKNEISDCSMAAFQVRGSKIKVKDSKIANNKTGIAVQDSEISIKESMILNNMEDGISLHNSDAAISKNIIMLNSDDGISFENSTAVINYNNIFNNAKYNINLEQAEGIDAELNFWGTDDIDKIHRFNYDRNDLSVLGEINIDDYFKSEINLIRLNK